MNIVDAEKAVVGSVIVDAHVLASVLEIAPPEYFSDRSVGTILRCMVALHERKEVVDIVTVQNEIRKTTSDPMLVMMIPECIEACVSSLHAVSYAKIVAGMHFERQVMILAKRLADTQEHSDMEKLGEAMIAKDRLGLPSLFDYQGSLHDMLDGIMKKAKTPMIETGFVILDNVLLGVRAGEVITWGAAPNVGKSLMLLNLAHVAARSGKKVLYVGTEMSAQETFQRHLSIVNGIEPWRLRKGSVSTEQIQSLNTSIGDVMSKMPLSILDYPEPSVKDVDAAISASGAEVVFLDYLERFKLPRAENFRLSVSEFMRQVKNLARERGVVIHLASQLGRATYGKDERRPTMADLSESSGIEKESDRIILLWAPREKQDPDPGTRRRMIEAILEKNRHGKKGLIFDLILNERNLRISSEAELHEPSFFESEQR